MSYSHSSAMAASPGRSAAFLKRQGYFSRPLSLSVLPALYAGALFSAVLFTLLFIGAVDISAAIPTAFLISLTALPAITALVVRGQDLFSPFQLVAGYFVIYYGARVAYLQLNPRALRLGLLEYDDYLPTAAWLAALAFGAFAAGYGLTRSKTSAKYLLRIYPRLPKHAPIIRLMALAGIGLAAHLYILSYGVIVGRTYTQNGMRDIVPIGNSVLFEKMAFIRC